MRREFLKIFFFVKQSTDVLLSLCFLGCSRTDKALRASLKSRLEERKYMIEYAVKTSLCAACRLIIIIIIISIRGLAIRRYIL